MINGNENWASLPYDHASITTTQELGESIADAYSPAEGDVLTIPLWNGATQTGLTTTGYYVEGVWYWDPEGGFPISTGMPFVVYPYHPPGITITWP
jgi:hypothetical protein